jgi:hypothetical protein
VAAFQTGSADRRLNGGVSMAGIAGLALIADVQQVADLGEQVRGLFTDSAAATRIILRITDTIFMQSLDNEW